MFLEIITQPELSSEPRFDSLLLRKPKLERQVW